MKYLNNYRLTNMAIILNIIYSGQSMHVPAMPGHLCSIENYKAFRPLVLLYNGFYKIRKKNENTISF